jgi:small subunit ribosomal protein S16
MKEGENYLIDLEKADKWIGVGARPSETVASIIRKARTSAAKA